MFESLRMILHKIQNTSYPLSVSSVLFTGFCIVNFSFSLFHYHKKISKEVRKKGFELKGKTGRKKSDRGIQIGQDHPMMIMLQMMLMMLMMMLMMMMMSINIILFRTGTTLKALGSP